MGMTIEGWLMNVTVLKVNGDMGMTAKRLDNCKIESD
jgi:hypothetical protein